MDNLPDIIANGGLISDAAMIARGGPKAGIGMSNIKRRKGMAQFDDVQVMVFEPNGRPDAGRPVKSREVPDMTPGRAALVGLMDRYLGGLLDPFVTLLEVHKLMYFMQEAEEPLRLSYKKHFYGRYAENLRQVLNRIEGHMVSGYADGGDRPDKELSLVPGAITDATAFLAHHPDTRARFDRVADLVEGFETPFGLELLSTVHWVVAHEGADSAEKAVSRTYAWADRKRRFSPHQLQLALEMLADKGWIPDMTTVGS